MLTLPSCVTSSPCAFPPASQSRLVRGGLVWGHGGGGGAGCPLAPVAEAHCLLTEIPLFHVLNARITFSNLCGCDEPLSSVWVPAPGSGSPASGTSVGAGGGHSLVPEPRG